MFLILPISHLGALSEALNALLLGSKQGLLFKMILNNVSEQRFSLQCYKAGFVAFTFHCRNFGLPTK